MRLRVLAAVSAVLGGEGEGRRVARVYRHVGYTIRPCNRTQGVVLQEVVGGLFPEMARTVGVGEKGRGGDAVSAAVAEVEQLMGELRRGSGEDAGGTQVSSETLLGVRQAMSLLSRFPTAKVKELLLQSTQDSAGTQYVLKALKVLLTLVEKLLLLE